MDGIIIIFIILAFIIYSNNTLATNHEKATPLSSHKIDKIPKK